MENRDPTPEQVAFFKARKAVFNIYETMAITGEPYALTEMPLAVAERQDGDGQPLNKLTLDQEALIEGGTPNAVAQNILQLHFFGDNLTKSDIGKITGTTRQQVTGTIASEYARLQRYTPFRLIPLTEMEKPPGPETAYIKTFQLLSELRNPETTDERIREILPQVSYGHFQKYRDMYFTVKDLAAHCQVPLNPRKAREIAQRLDALEIPFAAIETTHDKKNNEVRHTHISLKDRYFDEAIRTVLSRPEFSELFSKKSA